jgi:hypothetical protein
VESQKQGRATFDPGLGVACCAVALLPAGMIMRVGDRAIIAPPLVTRRVNKSTT